LGASKMAERLNVETQKQNEFVTKIQQKLKTSILSDLVRLILRLFLLMDENDPK
jgi:hypothetical protein